MPTLREDLIPLVDDLRREVVQDFAGLRIHTVVVRTRTWSGSQVGSGTPTDSDLEIDPAPRVLDPKPSSGRLRNSMGTQIGANPPGYAEEGDRTVDRISVTYSRDDLTGGSLVASNRECIWLIDGEPYRLVGIDEAFLEWRVSLRRMKSRG